MFGRIPEDPKLRVKLWVHGCGLSWSLDGHRVFVRNFASLSLDTGP